MSRECEEWFDKLEEMVNARLAELNPVDGRDAISKCQVYMDFDKVDQFSKFKGGRFTQDERNKDKAWDKSQIKAEYDKVERFADRNDNQKCEQAIKDLTDENINNWINNYFAEINVVSQSRSRGALNFPITHFFFSFFLCCFGLCGGHIFITPWRDTL